MKSHYFLAPRKQNDKSEDRAYKIGGYSTFTKFHLKTKCINNVKFTYLVETIEYNSFIFFKDGYYSYSNIYMDLGSIPNQLMNMFHNNEHDSWERAIKNCPTIQKMLTWNGIYVPHFSEQCDYFNPETINGEDYLSMGSKKYFLCCSCRGKVPYPNSEFENAIFEDLKNTAIKIIKEIKYLDESKLIAQKFNWAELAFYAILGGVAAYAVSEFSQSGFDGDYSNHEIDYGDLDYISGEDIEISEDGMISFKGHDTLPPNANKDGYTPDGTVELERTVSGSTDKFKLYTKDGHDYVLCNGNYIRVDGAGTVYINNIKYDKI